MNKENKNLEKARHTPGPWTITECGQIVAPLIGAKIWQQQTKHIAAVPFGADALAPATAGSERAANARLIAAAPEMAAKIERLEAEKAELLAALEGVLRECVLIHRYGGSADNSKAANAAEEAASAAIAKARGGK